MFPINIKQKYIYWKTLNSFVFSTGYFDEMYIVLRMHRIQKVFLFQSWNNDVWNKPFSCHGLRYFWSSVPMRLTLQATVFNKLLSFKNKSLSFFKNQLSIYMNYFSEAFNFLISILLMKIIRNFIALNLHTGLSMMCVCVLFIIF